VILGCDQATVRALLRCEAIEENRVGKTDDNPTGVRVNLQSVMNYKARHTIQSTEPPAKVKPARRRRREVSASYREPMMALRAMGSRV